MDHENYLKELYFSLLDNIQKRPVSWKEYVYYTWLFVYFQTGRMKHIQPQKNDIYQKTFDYAHKWQAANAAQTPQNCKCVYDLCHSVY